MPVPWILWAWETATESFLRKNPRPLCFFAPHDVGMPDSFQQLSLMRRRFSSTEVQEFGKHV